MEEKYVELRKQSSLPEYFLNLGYSKSSDHGVNLLLSKNLFNIKVSVWSGLNNEYQEDM